MLKIGITGATGFIGSHLLAQVPDQTATSVRVLIRTLSREPQPFPARFEVLQGDLNTPADCVAFVDGLDTVIHLAHANSPFTSDRHLPGDVLGSLIPTLNLIEAIRGAGTRPHVILASSGGSIYADCGERRPYREEDLCVPVSSYGIQKLAMELYFHLAARRGWLSATALRIGNAYGAPLPPQRKQGFIGVAIARVLRGAPIRVFGNPTNVRDYVHLDDLARAFTLATAQRQTWRAYNIGSGQGLTVLDIIGAIEAALGRAVDVLFEEGPSPADHLIPWSVLDVNRARRELGWTPTVPFEQGIRALLNN